MIKIRQAEKTLLNSALLTLMDIDTRGNWLHFLFNPISPINNGHGRPPCWVAIFCSFFWVNHPLMDPFWLRMNSSNANVIFYLASSMADHMPGFCRLTQFEYQFPIDMKYKVRIIIQVGKKRILLSINSTVLFTHMWEFFKHRECFQGSQDKFQIKVIRAAIIKTFNHHLMVTLLMWAKSVISSI